MEWPKDGQFFVNVSSRLGCLFWGRVERGESNAEAMGDCQASHWVFMVLISLKCQPGLRSCTRLFYKRLSLHSSDLDKISLLPFLARKVRRSIILTEAIVVHILIRPCHTNLHIFQLLSSMLSYKVEAFLIYLQVLLSEASACWWPDRIIIRIRIFGWAIAKERVWMCLVPHIWIP